MGPQRILERLCSTTRGSRENERDVRRTRRRDNIVKDIVGTIHSRSKAPSPRAATANSPYHTSKRTRRTRTNPAMRGRKRKRAPVCRAYFLCRGAPACQLALSLIFIVLFVWLKLFPEFFVLAIATIEERTGCRFSWAAGVNEQRQKPAPPRPLLRGWVINRDL